MLFSFHILNGIGRSLDKMLLFSIMNLRAYQFGCGFYLFDNIIFILDTVLAFLIPFVIYNVGCHIFKEGNIPVTSRDLMAFVSFKEQLLHAFCV